LLAATAMLANGFHMAGRAALSKSDTGCSSPERAGPI
jgi:hypothetical protein